MENCLDLLSVNTLRHRLDTGKPFSPGEASAIIDRVAELLDEIHLSGQVHGSINPENVLLLPDNKVQLRRTHSGLTASSPAARSRTTFVSGSCYLSPEEVRGESKTAATDIWCLGALLYEMLTGVAPFTALRVFMLRDMVSHDDPALLPRKAADAQYVVDRALAKWPVNRFVSAQEMANTLWASAPETAGARVTHGLQQAVSAPPVVKPTVSLQQAVNKPFTMSNASSSSHRTPAETKGWMRFFSGRKQSHSRAAA